MLMDLVLEIWLSILGGLNSMLPVGASSVSDLPVDIAAFAGNVTYYIDVAPLLGFLTVVFSAFVGFVVFKLALFIYKLLPFV